MPIPTDPDPRKRRAMNAARVTASSCSSQMKKQPCSCRGADTAKIDDGRRGRRERRIQKFEGTEHQTTKTSTDGVTNG